MGEITRAAAKLISERGFNGISLKDVADEVGMSQPGLLHYIGNKDGLLQLLISDVYDASGTPDDFLASGLPGSDPEAPLFPAYLRFLGAPQRRPPHDGAAVYGAGVRGVQPRAPRSMTISATARCRSGDYYSRFPWSLPPEVGAWDETMMPVVRQCIEAMDGIQLRWLREPPIDMV